MRRKVNRLLAALLVFVFSLSLMPEIAFAATPEKFELDFTQVDQSTLYEYKAGAYYLTSNKIEGQTFSAARKSDGDGVEWNILLTKADSPILAKNTGVRFFPANNDVRGMYIMFYNGNIDDGQGALSFEFTAPETGLYDVLIDAAYQDLGGIAKFYIDGMPMGEEIDFYITETDAKLREGVPVAAQMYITEGKHKIRIEAKTGQLENLLIYNDPIHAIITLEGTTIKIDGMESSFFMGVRREDTDNTVLDNGGRECTPRVQSAKFTLL